VRPEVTGKKVGAEPARLLVKIPTACQTIDCSRSRLYELMAQKRIESVKDGKSRKIVLASLNAYVEQLRMEAAA